MNDNIRGNQRRHEEDEENDHIDSFLRLGSKSYPIHIPPVVSPPRLAATPSFLAGPMTLSPSHPESSSSSWLINSFNETGGSLLTTTQLPPHESSSSNQTNPAMAIQVNTVSSSRTIQYPYPWAKNEKARIHTLEYLESNQITTITGDVECSYSHNEYQVSYNLRESFAELEKIFLRTKSGMRKRAPEMWTNPKKRRCDICGHEKSVKPKIAKRKREINWLFMLLGQTLGHCTLKQLKNFCKHSKIHRTGALDRVLYLTYLGLCSMLQPTNLLFHQ